MKCRSFLSVLPLMFAAALAACEGAAGPMGPMGPAGPAGPAGPGSRVVVSAVVNGLGEAVAVLPASVGTTMADPPGLTCYVSQPGSSVQLLIGTDLNGPTCGLVQASGALEAVMIEAPPGWTARFVAVR